MTRVSAGLMAAILTLPLAQTAVAQTKTLQGEMATISATVEAINASTRTITLKGPNGNYHDVFVPESVTKFPEIKVGDTITARYYDNIVLRLKAPGEKAVDSDATDVTRGSGTKPGITASKQRTITATITEIDQNVPSITFTGPNNWKYSSKVEDKVALSKVKVGDKVDITWTEALLVSFDVTKK